MFHSRTMISLKLQPQISKPEPKPESEPEPEPEPGHKYTAVIVEPRKHKALQFVVTNFLENLSDDWNIMIFHGTTNEQYVNDILQTLSSNRITTIKLPYANIPVKQYSLLLTSAAFYEAIPTEVILIFQTDTLIFSKNKHKINDFLQYDYVGAPWPPGYTPIGEVGNGGLSLRKKSKMLHIINTVPYRDEPEDNYFSRQKLYTPTGYEARNFSVEMVFHATSFGCHKPFNRSYGDALIKLYPELLELHKLNCS